MLYVVGTPIGNLDDLSIRQAKTILESEIVLSEDTGSTGLLLLKLQEMFDFQRHADQRIMSYNKDNEFEKLPHVIELLEDDKEVVLISQAGMPLISDPGYLLMKTVIKHELSYTVIPGPVASITALIHSGFNPKEHMFLGFLPKKASDIKKIIQKIQNIKSTFPDMVIIFYESPNRISDTLQIFSERIPGIKVSISRELTKIYEETVRGSAEELQKYSYKGELTVVIQ